MILMTDLETRNRFLGTPGAARSQEEWTGVLKQTKFARGWLNMHEFVCIQTPHLYLHSH